MSGLSAPGPDNVAGLLPSVLAAMVEGVVIQRQDGTIVFANPAAERVLGLQFDQLTGRTSIDPRWRAEHEDGSPFPGDTHPSMVTLGTGRAVRNVFMSVRRPDETRALIEVNAEPVFQAGSPRPTHVVATFIDVSERRADELRIRTLADTVSDLYNNAPCGYHSIDADGRYLQINDTELEWLGTTREAVLGRLGPVDFMTPESRARVENMLSVFVARGTLSELEVEFIGPGGQVRTVSVSATAVRNAAGEFVMSRSVAYDISELVRLRNQLLEQHARDQQVMLENELVAVARLRAGTIVWANAAIGRLFGYEPEQLVGTPIDALHVGGRPSLPSGGQLYDGSRQRVQTEMLRRDGARLWVDVYEAPIGDSGEVLALFGDLTPIRNAEARLVAAQRMESVGRLAGGVAHEFNNKLQAILGGVDLALMDVQASGPVARELREIQTAARHAATITQQLMAYARKRPSAPAAMDLNAAVDATLALVEPSIPPTIRVSTDLAPDTWPVMMDQAQFTDVLGALLLNAREAIDTTGRIEVETRNVHVDAEEASALPDARPGDYAVVVVRDTGRGMTPEVAAHAFDPFFTTKRFGQNSGLGLSTVYGSVTQHQGWVRLSTQPGAGCEMTVFLPRTGETGAPAAPVRRHATELRTVLLVEDDPGVRTIARAMLRRLGYDVLVASTAEDARALALASAATIDLLLSDVILPGMTGVELADALCAERRNLEVVLMTAYSAEALEERKTDVAGYEILPKPFTVKELEAAIAKAQH